MPPFKIQPGSDEYLQLKAQYESAGCTVEALAKQYDLTREHLTHIAKTYQWESRRARAKIKTTIKASLPKQTIAEVRAEFIKDNESYVDVLLDLKQRQAAEMIAQTKPKPQPTAAEASIILDAPKPNLGILTKDEFASARQATIDKLSSDGELLFAKLTNRLMQKTCDMIETNQIAEIIGLGGGVDKIEMREVAINDIKELKAASEIVRNIGAVMGKVNNTQQNNFQFNSTNVSTAQSPQNNIKYTEVQGEKARVLLASTIPVIPEPEVTVIPEPEDTNADATINQE
jgi:hypothetical protein